MNLKLSGNVNNTRGEYNGVYSYNGTINGKYYWIKNGGQAIWYNPEFQLWMIGTENYLGTQWHHMHGSNDSTCPKSYKLNSKWEYWGFSLNTYTWSWIDTTTDFKLSCIGK